MALPFTPKVVTANHLITGDVIYLDATGTWQGALAQAALFTDETTATRALAQALRRGRLAVGAYLADARAGAHGPEPAHFREAFRAKGPSNYAHGKQAEGIHV